MMACCWCMWHTHRPIFCLFAFLLRTFLVWTEIATSFLLYMHTKLGLIQVAALVRSISHMVGVCNRGWGREAAVGIPLCCNLCGPTHLTPPVEVQTFSQVWKQDCRTPWPTNNLLLYSKQLLDRLGGSVSDAVACTSDSVAQFQLHLKM